MLPPGSRGPHRGSRRRSRNPDESRFAPAAYPHRPSCRRRFETASYVWENGLTSSHNDGVPGNILFDGSRLWCIDWESAYLNDPLVDLAIALDNFAQTPALENILIRSWEKGRSEHLVPDRLAQVRSLTRLYYAGVFFSGAAAAGITGDGDASARSVADVMADIRSGLVEPRSPTVKNALGKLYLDAFMTGTVAPPVTVFAELEETFLV